MLDEVRIRTLLNEEVDKYLTFTESDSSISDKEINELRGRIKALREVLEIT